MTPGVRWFIPQIADWLSKVFFNGYARLDNDRPDCGLGQPAPASPPSGGGPRPTPGMGQLIKTARIGTDEVPYVIEDGPAHTSIAAVASQIDALKLRVTWLEATNQVLSDRLYTAEARQYRTG